LKASNHNNDGTTEEGVLKCYSIMNQIEPSLIQPFVCYKYFSTFVNQNLKQLFINISFLKHLLHHLF